MDTRPSGRSSSQGARSNCFHPISRRDHRHLRRDWLPIPPALARCHLSKSCSTNNFWIGGTVRALAVSATNLYAGVDDHVAKWDGSSWTVLPDWTTDPRDVYPYVYALAVSGNDLYAGGNYLTYGFDYEEYYVGRVSKWNGTNWSAWGDFYNYPFSQDPYVSALAVSGSN